MRRVILSGLALFVVLAAMSAEAGQVEISYNLSDLGGGRWEAEYSVSNVSLGLAVEEFTLYYDYGKYANLAAVTASPLADGWDEVVAQPEPLLHDAGMYDALTLGAGIGIGETVSGFAVRFDWLGQGGPTYIPFEVVDPDTFQTLATGTAMPEPGTGAMVLMGALALCRRRRRGGREILSTKF